MDGLKKNMRGRQREERLEPDAEDRPKDTILTVKQEMFQMLQRLELLDRLFGFIDKEKTHYPPLRHWYQVSVNDIKKNSFLSRRCDEY